MLFLNPVQEVFNSFFQNNHSHLNLMLACETKELSWRYLISMPNVTSQNLG